MDTMLIIPERLAATCRGTPECRAWLEQLPTAIREVQDRWSLVLVGISLVLLMLGMLPHLWPARSRLLPGRASPISE